MDISSITLNNLYVFKTVIEVGSVSAAAKLLNKNQSTISAALRLIKKTFGDDVMKIQGGCCVATTKGLQICNYIGELIHVATDYVETSQIRRYKVLTSDFFALLYMPAFINACNLHNIDIEMEVVRLKTLNKMQCDMSQFDLCIGMEDRVLSIPCQPLMETQSVVITSKNSAFDAISFVDYLQAEHITMHKTETAYIKQTIGHHPRNRVILSNSLLTSMSLLSSIPNTVMTTEHHLHEHYRNVFQFKQVNYDFEFEKKLLFYSWKKTVHSEELARFFTQWWQNKEAESNKERNLKQEILH